MTAPAQDPPAGRGWRADVALLRRRNVALLVSSRLVSDLGTGIAPIALAFGVLALPGGDAGSLGLVLLCATLPRVLLVLLGGVLADRVNRSRLMVGADSMAAAAQLCAAALFLTGRATVPALAALAVVNGTAVALFYPALTGLVPQLADGDDLQSVNALVRLSSNVSRILGTVVGGLLVAAFGAGWALAVDGLTFAVSAVLLFALRIGARGGAASSGSVLHDLREGWREFTSRRWVWFVVVLFSFSNMGFQAAIGVLGPVRAQQSWGGAAGWASVLAAFWLGTVVGVVVALRIRPSRPLRVAMAAQLAIALPVLAMAPPLPLLVVVLLAFVCGLCIDVFEVLWQTALQQNIPPESLSRVSSYDWLGSTSLGPLALAGVGALVSVVGLETSIWVCAGLCAVTGLGLLDPQVRALRAGGPTATTTAAPSGEVTGQ